MLQYVKVTIDGAPVRAEKGASVLDKSLHQQEHSKLIKRLVIGKT